MRETEHCGISLSCAAKRDGRDEQWKGERAGKRGRYREFNTKYVVASKAQCFVFLDFSVREGQRAECVDRKSSRHSHMSRILPSSVKEGLTIQIRSEKRGERGYEFVYHYEDLCHNV